MNLFWDIRSSLTAPLFQLQCLLSLQFVQWLVVLFEAPSDLSETPITFTAAPPIKQTRSKKPKKPLLIAPADFSERRMTRSVAKLKGFKPTSALSPKQKPLRQPRAKKLKTATIVPDDLPPAEQSTKEQAVPDEIPPTPIPTMQQLGASLGIPAEELTVEKLMASPGNATDANVSNDV